jgi:predicted transcriptional regulator
LAGLAHGQTSSQLFAAKKLVRASRTTSLMVFSLGYSRLMTLSILALSPSGTRIVIVSFMAIDPLPYYATVRLICQLLLIVTISSDSMLYDSIKKQHKPYNHTQNELPAMKEKVLLCFAENGEMNIYQISQLCEIGYSTAHSSIKALERKRLVRLKSASKNEKGVIAKSYDLTAKGIYQAIVAKSSWNEKTAIAEKRKKLLGQNFLDWLKFIQDLNDKGIEKQVNTQIGYCIGDYSTPSLLELRYSSPYRYDDSVDDSLFDLTILTKIITQNNVLGNILNVIEKYPSIKKKLQKLIEEQIQWDKDDLKKLEMIKAEFEKQY